MHLRSLTKGAILLSRRFCLRWTYRQCHSAGRVTVGFRTWGVNGWKNKLPLAFVASALSRKLKGSCVAAVHVEEPNLPQTEEGKFDVQEVLQCLRNLHIEPDEVVEYKKFHSDNEKENKQKKEFFGYVDQVIKDNLAYRCFCPKSLSLNHESDPCLTMSTAEVSERVDSGDKFVVFLKNKMVKQALGPDPVMIEDLCLGKIKQEMKNMKTGMKILVARQDGYPGNGLLGAVFNHNYGITHKLEFFDKEYTDKESEVIYHKLLNIPLPVYCHIPNLVPQHLLVKKKLHIKGDRIIFHNGNIYLTAYVNQMAKECGFFNTNGAIMEIPELLEKFEIPDPKKANRRPTTINVPYNATLEVNRKLLFLYSKHPQKHATILEEMVSQLDMLSKKYFDKEITESLFENEFLCHTLEWMLTNSYEGTLKKMIKQYTFLWFRPSQDHMLKALAQSRKSKQILAFAIRKLSAQNKMVKSLVLTDDELWNLHNKYVFTALEFQDAILNCLVEENVLSIEEVARALGRKEFAARLENGWNLVASLPNQMSWAESSKNANFKTQKNFTAASQITGVRL